MMLLLYALEIERPLHVSADDFSRGIPACTLSLADGGAESFKCAAAAGTELLREDRAVLVLDQGTGEIGLVGAKLADGSVRWWSPSKGEVDPAGLPAERGAPLS